MIVTVHTPELNWIEATAKAEIATGYVVKLVSEVSFFSLFLCFPVHCPFPHYCTAHVRHEGSTTRQYPYYTVK